MQPMMEVEIDGEKCQRPVDHYHYDFDRAIRLPYPVLQQAEEVFWEIGSTVPVIIKTGSQP